MKPISEVETLRLCNKCQQMKFIGSPTDICGDCKEPVLDRDLVRKVIKTILKFGVNYDQLSSLQKRLLEDDVSLLARKSITQVRKEWEEERNQMLTMTKHQTLEEQSEVKGAREKYI